MAQAIVEPDMIPSAVGFITCAQVTGVTISSAIANSVFLNGAQKSISVLLPDVPVEVVQGAIGGAGSKFVESLSASMQRAVLVAIVDAMSKTYILILTAGALVFVLSFAMKREKLFIAAGGAA